jgi:hypothetical protein
MTPPTYCPSTIYIEIDVSNLSLIDAERYYNAQKAGFLMPDGCSARGMMDVDEVDEE